MLGRPKVLVSDKSMAPPAWQSPPLARIPCRTDTTLPIDVQGVALLAGAVERHQNVGADLIAARTTFAGRLVLICLTLVYIC